MSYFSSWYQCWKYHLWQTICCDCITTQQLDLLCNNFQHKTGCLQNLVSWCTCFKRSPNLDASGYCQEETHHEVKLSWGQAVVDLLQSSKIPLFTISRRVDTDAQASIDIYIYLYCLCDIERNSSCVNYSLTNLPCALNPTANWFWFFLFLFIIYFF